MTLDAILAIVFVFFVAKGLWKGLVVELVSILSLIAAVLVAFLFHKEALVYLEAYVSTEYSTIVAYAVLFLVTYIVVQLFGKLLDKIVRSVMLGGINRVLGGVFGALKALFWLTAATYLFDLVLSATGLSEPAAAKASLVLPFLRDLASVALGFV